MSYDAQCADYLDRLCYKVHSTARNKGFWEKGITEDVVGYKLALVHSEVTEILEAVRKSGGANKVAEEFADTIIRLCDLYEAMRTSGKFDLPPLDEAVHIKSAINDKRERLHGWSWG